jgi:hypothetical protein
MSPGITAEGIWIFGKINDKRYRGIISKYSISSGKSYFAAKRKNSTFYETINV